MFVRMLTGLAGPDRNHKFGDIVEFEDAEGQRFLDAGLAEAADKPTAEDLDSIAAEEAAKAATSGQSQEQTAPAKAISRMNRTELVEHAKTIGVDHAPEATKAQIVEAINTKGSQA